MGKTERTFPQKSEDGQILNIYGEPLTEPKPKYVPIEETETEENTGKSSKKDKAIYLEAIDNSNVHTEAGQEYPAVDVTEIGEKCRYLGVNEYGWLLIKTEDGHEGYVYLIGPAWRTNEYKTLCRDEGRHKDIPYG